MAIYHLSTKPISRSSGRSATASSAYRAGAKITDERTGLIHDYTKRNGVVMALAFDKYLNALDRNELWNKAELAEKRKDARTAREYVIAIPAELIPENENDQKNPNTNDGAFLAIEFAQKLAERYNVGVDVAIHAPDKEGDNRNWHAHIMTTTRQLSQGDDGIELGDKSLIELSNKKLGTLNAPKTQQQVKDIRELWAELANNALAENGHEERIDHRSHAERGLAQQPTIKLGWKASAMERQGMSTDRGDLLRTIKQHNQSLADLELEIVADRKQLIPTPYYNPHYQQKIIDDIESEIDEIAEKLLEQDRRECLAERDIERMQTLTVDNVNMSEYQERALQGIGSPLSDAYAKAKRAQNDTANYYKSEKMVTGDVTETVVNQNEPMKPKTAPTVDSQQKRRRRP